MDSALVTVQLITVDFNEESIFIKSEPPDDMDLDDGPQGSPVNIKVEPDLYSDEEPTENISNDEASKPTQPSKQKVTKVYTNTRKGVQSSPAKSQPQSSSVAQSLSVAQSSAVTNVVQSVSGVQSLSGVQPNLIQSSPLAQTNTVSALPQNNALNLLQNNLMMQSNNMIYVLPSNVPGQPYQFIMANPQTIGQLGSQAVGVIPLPNSALNQFQQMQSGTIQQTQQVPGGTIQQVPGGTIQQVTGGTIQQVPGGTIQQVPGGTIQQVGGTIQQVGGTIQQVSGGTIQQVPGGTIQQVGGTIQQVPGGTIQQVPGGTIQQLPNGTFQQVGVGGTIQQIQNGTIQQTQSGTIQQVPGVGTIQQLPNGTLQQLPNGMIQQVSSGTIQQTQSGTIQQVAGGTIQQVTGGTLQQLPNGTIQQVSSGIVQTGTTQPVTSATIQQNQGGTVQQVQSGTTQPVQSGITGSTIQQIQGGTIQQVQGGTIQQLTGGTIQKLQTGPVQQVPGGTIQQISSSTIQHLSGGTLQQISGGTLQQVTNGIPQMTTQNLTFPNNFLPQNNQNIQMGGTSILPQTMPMSGSFMPQLTQNMQLPNGFILQTGQQNIQPVNNSQKSIESKTVQTLKIPRSRNLKPRKEKSKPISMSSLQSLVERVATKRLMDESDTTIIALKRRKKKGRYTILKLRKISQTTESPLPSTPTPPPPPTPTPPPPLPAPAPTTIMKKSTGPKTLKPLLPKSMLETPKPPVTTIASTPQQQTIPTTSSIMPQSSQSSTPNSTASQQNIIVSNPLQASQNLILPQQGFTLAGNLLPQTVQSNNVLPQNSNVLPLTSQNISLGSNLLPQTVQSGSVLPLTSQNISLASNLLPQTVTSGNILPQSSPQTFTLAGNLLPQTVTSGSILPQSSPQTFTLAGNLLPQTVTSGSILPQSSPQTFTLAGNLLPQTVTSGSILPQSSPQTFTLAGNLLPQTVTSGSILPQSSPQTFTLAGNLLPQTVKSNNLLQLAGQNGNLLPQSSNVLTLTSQNILSTTMSSQIVQNLPVSTNLLPKTTEKGDEAVKKGSDESTIKTPLDDCSEEEIKAEPKYMTRSAKREMENVSKKTDATSKPVQSSSSKSVGSSSKLIPILPSTLKPSNLLPTKFVTILPAPSGEATATSSEKTAIDDGDQSENSENEDDPSVVVKSEKVDENSNPQLVGDGDWKSERVEKEVSEEASTTTTSNKHAADAPLIMAPSMDLSSLLQQPEKNSNGLYNCPKCFAEHSTIEDLKMHDQIYHSGNYMCVCGKRMDSMMGLKIHRHACPMVSNPSEATETPMGKYFIAANDEKPVKGVSEKVKKAKEDKDKDWEYDGEEGEDDEEYEEEIATVRDGFKKCPHCKMKVISKHLQKHFAQCHLRASGKYACDVCTKVFPSSFHVNEHMEVHERKFRCRFCKQAFEKSWSLRQHMWKHYQDRKYKCDKCNYTFRLKTELMDHQMSHSSANVSVYKCDECNINFSSERVLQTHLESHSSRNRCEVCKTNCSSKVQLNRHMKQFHPDPLKPRTPTPPLPDISPKINETDLNLTECVSESVKTDQPATAEGDPAPETKSVYRCKLCTCLFATESIIRRHLKTHYTIELGEKLLQSNIETIVYKENLSAFKCKLCGCRFYSKRLVKNHIRTHFLRRPFTCNMCGCTFDTAEKLNHHKQFHEQTDDRLKQMRLYQELIKPIVPKTGLTAELQNESQQSASNESPELDVNTEEGDQLKMETTDTCDSNDKSETSLSDEMFVKIASCKGQVLGDNSDVQESESLFIKMERLDSPEHQEEEGEESTNQEESMNQEETSVKTEGEEVEDAAFPFSIDFSTLRITQMTTKRLMRMR
ncbi:mucin-2 [Nilaparvata lugens]|uniref:mucin-2 n=1 Tax=Nilaparvata lugens TaxID=108931 RepID=UPI00193E3C42|nr:mucin-2 [Nilaparvata lugens]